MKNRPVVVVLLLTLVLLLGIGSSPSGSAAEGTDMIWTQWDADHYAMVDDGETIWIGSGSGLIRWGKASGTHSRISTAEGLPHRRVFSAVVDGEGNRWFGGDAGLSRLTPNEEWSHYDTSNSGLFSDSVADIAVTADGSVWLSHTDSPYVNRLGADNAWELYPNRQSAVILAYETVKQTSNQNHLWAAADDEVWVDYDVFNGTRWQNRLPDPYPNSPYPYSGPPRLTIAGSGNKVWALDSIYGVFFWDGEQWGEYPYWPTIDGGLNTLTVNQNDEVWVGGLERFHPYFGLAIGYTRLPEKPGEFNLENVLFNFPPPIAALLATNEGLWGTGPNWLHNPDGEMIKLSDAPAFKDVKETVVDRQGRTWVLSEDFYFSELQTFDDVGTATMADDQWIVKGSQDIVTALEPAPDGDLWVGWEILSRVRFPGVLDRYYGNKKKAYTPPFKPGFVDDIYARDRQHIWFAYSDQLATSETENRGVWSLDDGGTPADSSDDIWAQVPINTDGSDGIVAVVGSQLWYGDTSGLYLYQEPDWEKASSIPVEGLVPGANGELFVDNGWQVLVVEQDGRQTFSSSEDLITNDLARIQTTVRRNKMWTVAPDDAVWYWQSSDELARRDAQGLKIFKTPTRSDYVEVDENNHVWLADGSLWRVSPIPDFSLEIGPSSWLMTPNGSRSGRILIESKEGYQETVELSISGLPAGVTAEIVPESLPAGESAVLTVTTDGAALGETTITIKGTSGMLNRQRSFKLAVVEYATDSLLTIVVK